MTHQEVTRKKKSKRRARVKKRLGLHREPTWAERYPWEWQRAQHAAMIAIAPPREKSPDRIPMTEAGPEVREMLEQMLATMEERSTKSEGHISVRLQHDTSRSTYIIPVSDDLYHRGLVLAHI